MRDHGLKGSLLMAVLVAGAIALTACAPQGGTSPSATGTAPAATATDTAAAAAETASPAADTATATAAMTPAATDTATAAVAAAETPAAQADTTDFWTGGYQVITAKQGKQILDNDKDIILLDVREPDEYAQGHIPNARLMPLGTIAKQAPTDLPDRDAKLIVYCRSGRRSKMAADTLLTLGYTHVLDMGGILDWPYEVVK